MHMHGHFFGDPFPGVSSSSVWAWGVNCVMHIMHNYAGGPALLVSQGALGRSPRPGMMRTDVHLLRCKDKLIAESFRAVDAQVGDRFGCRRFAQPAVAEPVDFPLQ